MKGFFSARIVTDAFFKKIFHDAFGTVATE